MTITGRAALASARATAAIACASAAGNTGRAAGARGSLLIASIRCSLGTETKTGPRGAVSASWQARCTVCGSKCAELRPKLHFTHDSISRAGPPTSVSTRNHCRPAGGAGGSPKETDSPARTTIGTRSCSAARTPIEAWREPTVVWITTAGSLPVALA